MTNAPMTNDQLHHKPITEQAAMLRAREISPVDLTRAYLDRIAALNDQLGAYITVMADHALAQARQAEADLQAGNDKGALHGIPIAVKDIIHVQGTLTTAGSKVLADFTPDHDSTITRRLHAAGATLLGKLNLSEFAIGGTIEHPFGTPRNPWNTDHTAGGSSSGSGIATAAGLCAGALGSDTGGSVRGPAAFCGIVGLRPTYGRVTRHGVIPMCWSMDTVGPMTRTVADCALMLNAIAGKDPLDPASANAPVPDHTATLHDGIQGLRIALPTEMFAFEGLDDDVRQTVLRAVAVLEEHGASAHEISLPMSENSGAVFIGAADVECAAYHADNLRTRGNDYDWSTRNPPRIRIPRPRMGIPQSAARPRANPPRTHRSPRQLRHHHHPHRPRSRPHHRSIHRQARRLLPRQTRPRTPDVHKPRRPRRPPRPIRPLRHLRRRPPHRHAAHRQALPRANPTPRRPILPSRHPMAHPPPHPITPSNPLKSLKGSATIRPIYGFNLSSLGGKLTTMPT